jgi:hypothetical protein
MILMAPSMRRLPPRALGYFARPEAVAFLASGRSRQVREHCMHILQKAKIHDVSGDRPTRR